MKTAVSIPDRVYERAEQTAKRLGKSRSRLYAEAMGEYVARHDPEEVTEEMNRVCESIGGATDPFVLESARRILKNTEW